MNLLGWLSIGAVGIVALIAALQYRASRGTYRPLSERQPAPHNDQDEAPPLGTEAIDMKAFQSATRRNEALEASRAKWLNTNETPETGADYAAWFHKSFNKRKLKD